MKLFLDFAEVQRCDAPPVLVEQDHNCAECGSVHEIEHCPKCGSDIGLGFGLAGGGFGEYKYCLGEKGDCDWFWKESLPLDEC